MKKLLWLVCGAMLIASYADGQDISINSQRTNTTSRSVTDNRGTVIDYAPGTSITIDDGNGAAPVRFNIADNVQVIGSDGNSLSPSAVKKNAMVQLHFTQESGGPVVDQIKVEKMIKQQP